MRKTKYTLFAAGPYLALVGTLNITTFQTGNYQLQSKI
jgi:hypothetical protein